jgi:hypothetical protein
VQAWCKWSGVLGIKVSVRFESGHAAEGSRIKVSI